MNHIGRETRIVAGRDVYILSRYTRRLAKEMLAWVQSRLGNPLADLLATLDAYPPAIHDHLVDDAIDLARSYRSLFSEPVLQVWQSEPGRTEELRLLLRQHHPQADAEAIYQQVDPDALATAVMDCTGRMPARDEDELDYLREMGLVPPARQRPQPVEDWLKIDKLLMREFHFKPWEIDDLTLTEIFVLCQSVADEAERQRDADDTFIDADKLHHVQQWAAAQKKLTPAQRLQIALRTMPTIYRHG